MLAALLALSGPVSASGITFNNPPPPGPTIDNSKNPVYTLGSSIEVSWSGLPGPEFSFKFNIILQQVTITPDGAYKIPDFWTIAAESVIRESAWG